MSMATILQIPTTLSLLRTQTNSLLLSPLLHKKSSKFICTSSTSLKSQKNLILYSKPGCCLCDGLKEKLHGVLSLPYSSSDPLYNVQLQIRDITTNEEWERAYQYEIPVLSKLLPDGCEERLPRLSPRLGVELVQRKLEDAFRT